MSNNRSNETIAAEAITQYWLDEEKRDDTDPFIAKSSEQHDKEMGDAVIEALTAAGRLAGDPTEAQVEAAAKALTGAADAFEGATINIEIFSDPVEREAWRRSNETRAALVNSLRDRAEAYRREETE